MDFNAPGLNHLLDCWLAEDLGRGDLTSNALLNINGSACWIAKQDGLFCGGNLATYVFQRLHQSVQIDLLVKDGESFTAGERLLELQGPAQALVAGE